MRPPPPCCPANHGTPSKPSPLNVIWVSWRFAAPLVNSGWGRLEVSALLAARSLWPCKKVLCSGGLLHFDLYRSETVPIKRNLRSEPCRQVSRKQIPGHLRSSSVAISSRTSFLGAAGFLLLLVLGTHATGHQKSFVAAQIPKNILGYRFVILFKFNQVARKHPPIPLPYSLNKAELKKKKCLEVRLIPDSSNSLPLCWLLFAPSGPFCLFCYPALSRQTDFSHCIVTELPFSPDSC